MYLVAANRPYFVNPQVDDVRLANARRKGTPPIGSLRVVDEVTGVGKPNYTAATAFAIDDDTYFINRERTADGLLKHGVHLIFPEVKIQIEQALVMREALVERLRVEYGMTHPDLAPHGWSDVVDNAVYGTGKGLRMYGANKTIKCPECRAGKEHKCGDRVCKVGGTIDIGRPHLLHSVYIDAVRSTKHEQLYRRQLGQIIRRTSIRTVLRHPVSGWARYTGCPTCGDALKTSVNKAGDTVHAVKSKDPVFKSDMKLRAPHMVDVTDTSIANMFEKHIRTRFVAQYKTLRVINVKRTESGIYFISVGGEGQHFCLNKMPPADHTSNTIYFQCTRKGICARCRCPKLTEENRAKGMCKDFCSTVRAISQSDIDTLFPDASLSFKLSGKATKKQRV